jgi:hypothetical protein
MASDAALLVVDYCEVMCGSWPDIIEDAVFPHSNCPGIMLVIYHQLPIQLVSLYAT